MSPNLRHMCKTSNLEMRTGKERRLLCQLADGRLILTEYAKHPPTAAQARRASELIEEARQWLGNRGYLKPEGDANV